MCVCTQTRLLKVQCGWKSWGMWCLWCRREVVGEHEGNNHLEDNIIMELQEIEWNRVDWIHLAQVRDKWQAPLSMIMKLFTGWGAGHSQEGLCCLQSVTHTLQTWCVSCVNCCIVYYCGRLWHLRFSQECVSTSGAFSSLKMAAAFPCTVLHSVTPEGCVHWWNSQ